MQDIDQDLCDEIIDRVCKADASDQPVTVGRGMLFDRWMKGALAIRGVHQSTICLHVKHLVSGGLLRYADTDETVTVYMGEREREYPRVQLLPA